eukprot:2624293-Rhodomonas_salina.1
MECGELTEVRVMAETKHATMFFILSTGSVARAACGRKAWKNLRRGAKGQRGRKKRQGGARGRQASA